MITEVEGNLLTYPDIQVIAHQTNCLGVMGGGIAKQIKAMYPNMFKRYKHLCDYPNDNHILLGNCFPCDLVEDGNSIQVIANLFGEYSFCESVAPFNEGGKPRHTDYDALKSALKALHLWLIGNGKKTVGMPYKLGCGLAGGDWDGVVYPMIKAEFENDDNIILYIVKYKG